jgi:glycine hydroxymethyltransferase
MFRDNVTAVEQLVKEQEEWRSQCLNLIASEQVMSRRARAVMGSDFGHRYAEGHPGERYYQGTEKIDRIESEVKQYLKVLFNCLHTEVRPISGTNANESVFSQYIAPGDIVLVNSTSAGGHISHQVSGSVGKFTRNVVAFPQTPDGYRIDVAKTKDLIRAVRPTMAVFGRSLFLFPEPLRDLFDVCGQYGVRMVYDGAHVLGLIAGKQFQSPLVEGASVVMASTHKTFPGPQRGLILSNLNWEEWRRIDRGAFPGSSSNHHLDTLAPLLITTYEMLAFGEAYAKQVVANAQRLAGALAQRGLAVEGADFGYTQTHQVAVNVAAQGGGSAVSTRLKDNAIILNMNLLPNEPLRNHNNPSGVRLGVQEMTRLGMREAEMDEIARLITECVCEGKDVGAEVRRFRAPFQTVHFSYDPPEPPADSTAATSGR